MKKVRTPWNKGLKTGLIPKTAFKKGGHYSLETEFKKGNPGFWLGKKRPNLKNTNSFKTMFKKGQTVGNKNPKWKGGITATYMRIRNSTEYKKWRMKVYQRDRFSCVICGYRSKKPKDIRADHIKPFSLYPELRFDVNNGRTLCLSCDLKVGWNYLREREALSV